MEGVSGERFPREAGVFPKAKKPEDHELMETIGKLREQWAKINLADFKESKALVRKYTQLIRDHPDDPACLKARGLFYQFLTQSCKKDPKHARMFSKKAERDLKEASRLSHEHKAPLPKQGSQESGPARASYPSNHADDDYDTTSIESIRTAAEKGNPKAQGDLGSRHLLGQGVELSQGLGRLWLKKAAKKDDRFSCYFLGLDYLETEEFDEGVSWLSRGLELGDSTCALELSSCYRGTQAIFYLRKYIDMLTADGKEDATWSEEFKIGLILEDIHGEGCSQAVEIYYKLAAKVYQKAQDRLLKLNIENYDPTFIESIRAAAEMGNPRAQSDLGKRHLSGKGVEQSQSLGRLWLKKAAKKGHRLSCYALGLDYFETKEFDEGISWLSRGLELGDASCALELFSYYDGIESISYLRKYIDILKLNGEDVVAAKFKLGQYLEHFHGKGYPEAVEVYQKLAAKGYEEAQDRLSDLGL